jgi:aminoglycoside/choline kinase family phosphotransferase/dTDP-glucose pyrophosphorylase
MKALILAAGLGTRLQPHTLQVPKPLFSIGGRPLLDHLVAALHRAGCTHIAVNTHHLAQRIDDYIASRAYPLPVTTRWEPNILGTAGAIRNLTEFWDKEPFWVVNGDIVTDIDLAALMAHHRRHDHLVTLCLHHRPEFAAVLAPDEEHVSGFQRLDEPQIYNRESLLAFTGIQVLEPAVLDWIPEGAFVDIIEVYRRMITAGHGVAAYISRNHQWYDIGTEAGYRQAALSTAAPMAFREAFGSSVGDPYDIRPLHGDGSDRRWYRLSASCGTLILADHGIHSHIVTGEAQAYTAIGRHLFAKGVPVPEIHFADPFSGLVFIQDLGDTNLQACLKQPLDRGTRKGLYEQVIDALVRLAVDGADGFDPNWAYQGAAYDRKLILDRECRYFLEAFVNGYLDMPLAYNHLGEEFENLATASLEQSVLGLMHRDMQSRNIMVSGGYCYFIDFQGARQGPVQYDLASLLIDPYVQLPETFQTDLLHAYYDRWSQHSKAGIPWADFQNGYRYCAVCRNLQILGAFGYLSKVKGKGWFSQYIPAAARSLVLNLQRLESRRFPRLYKLSRQLEDFLKQRST